MPLDRSGYLPAASFRRSKAFVRESAFTIIEMLVAAAILSVILVLVFSVMGQASTVWRRSTDQIEAFQSARMAFDLLTHNLSQATINAYLDYDNSSDPTKPPTKYLRKSDLKFLSENAGSIGGTANTGQIMFFQTPGNFTSDTTSFGGLGGLLNTCGYFVEFGSDAGTKPSFVQSPDKYRYRLKQLLVPTEGNEVYKAAGTSWATDALGTAIPIADNIVALIIRPQDPSASPTPDLTSNYLYDTTAWNPASGGTQPATSNQLPPVVEVTMVAIEENAAKRMEKGTNPPAAVDAALHGKFLVPSQYDSDLTALEAALDGATPPIPYRIFTSAVPIRESKWTK